MAEVVGHRKRHLRSVEKLKNVPRDVLDAELKRLNRSRDIQLMEDPNRKAIPKIGHEAAVEIGLSPKHLITIGEV